MRTTYVCMYVRYATDCAPVESPGNPPDRLQDGAFTHRIAFLQSSSFAHPVFDRTRVEIWPTHASSSEHPILRSPLSTPRLRRVAGPPAHCLENHIPYLRTSLPALCRLPTVEPKRPATPPFLRTQSLPSKRRAHAAHSTLSRFHAPALPR